MHNARGLFGVLAVLNERAEKKREMSLSLPKPKHSPIPEYIPLTVGLSGWRSSGLLGHLTEEYL
jgi:hypothetical protein